MEPGLPRLSRLTTPHPLYHRPASTVPSLFKTPWIFTMAFVTSIHPNRYIYSVACDLRTDINSWGWNKRTHVCLGWRSGQSLANSSRQNQRILWIYCFSVKFWLWKDTHMSVCFWLSHSQHSLRRAYRRKSCAFLVPRMESLKKQGTEEQLLHSGGEKDQRDCFPPASRRSWFSEKK